MITRNGTHFAEVADGMAALGVADRHDVEEERLDIVVQRFVIQEEFRQQAEILTILFVSFTVHFPYAEFVLPVKLKKVLLPTKISKI